MKGNVILVFAYLFFLSGANFFGNENTSLKDQHANTNIIEIAKKQIPRSSKTQTRMISHLTAQGGGFTTHVHFRNITGTTRSYSLLPYDTTGKRLPAVQGEINANATLSIDSKDLFAGTSASHFVISEGDDLSITVSYQAPDEPGSPAHIQESSNQQEVWRSFTGDWSEVFDGLAIVNTGSLNTDVGIRQISFSGTAIQTENVSEDLKPFGKGLFVVGGPSGSLFSDQPDVFYQIQATQSLAVTALRGTQPGVPIGYLWENKASAFNVQTGDNSGTLWGSDPIVKNLYFVSGGTFVQGSIDEACRDSTNETAIRLSLKKEFE